MLLQIGRAQSVPTNVLSWLRACHERIRHFATQAVTLSTLDVGDSRWKPAAVEVETYFTQALGHHAHDEDDSIFPWISSLDSNLDDTLAELRRQHETHPSVIATLVRDLHASDRIALAHSSAVAQQMFEQHLALEEQQVFPFVQQHLDKETEQSMLRAFRARRA